MPLTKLILSHNVYRRPAATNEATAPGYLPAGSVVDLEEVVFGKELDGSRVWYRAGDGFFYWSGGVRDAEFAVPSLDFGALTDAQQRALCLEAQRHYLPRLKAAFPDLAGLAVNQKQRNGAFLPGHSLLFYVPQKLDSPARRLPASLPFKGFAIPTDVRETLPVGLCRIGQHVGKPGLTLGTGGFVAVDATDRYLVTGYHVLCHDLLRDGQKLLLPNDASYDDRRDVHDAFGTLAHLLGGTMDAFTDSVKARLTRPLGNDFSDGTTLNGFVARAALSDAPASPTAVTMLGAATGDPRTGVVTNLHFDLDIPLIDHSFFNLIEISVPAKHGDSGAPVFTVGTRQLVGIVAATNFVDRSYVIPIETILRRLALTGVA